MKFVNRVLLKRIILPVLCVLGLNFVQAGASPAYGFTMTEEREVGEKLRQYTREGRWQEMDGLVSEEIVSALVPSATYDEIADVLLEQFAGVIDRILLPVPADPADDDAIRRVIEKLRAG